MIIFEPTMTYRPFKAPWAMELAEEHSIALYWDRHQVDLQDDIRQYHEKDGLKTMSVTHDINKHILTMNLNIFTQMDVAAGALYCKLLPHVQNNEIRNWFMVAAARESTHQRCYAMIVEELGFPESSWGEFMEYQEMQEKIDLMTDVDNLDPATPFGFACILAQLLLAEGICLFGAFASMLNLKRSGLMQGTNKVNEWSLRDEERHVHGNMRALADCRTYLTDEQNAALDAFIRRTVIAYVEAEFKYIELVYEKGGQEGMTATDMKDYIMYLADLRLAALDLPVIYKIDENPLEWMDWILSGRKHGNFFEEKQAGYDHTGLVGEINYSKYVDWMKEM